MRTKINLPYKMVYPFLAVYTHGNPLPNEHQLKTKDIYLVSKVWNDVKQKNIPFAQPLLGGEQGHFIEKMEDLIPLPSGATVELKQTHG